MADPQSGPPVGNDRSLEIAESLRALCDQADQTHNAYCQSVKQIELQIDQQLEQIANELASEQLLEQLAAQTLDFEKQIEERDEELLQLLELAEEENQERETLRQNLQQTLNALEQTKDSLAEAEKNLQQLRQSKEENDEELEQVRRKFELALADAHKLKRENTELHEELLSRPEADDQESPELISLRTERDALAAHIDELETASTQTPPTDGQQELDDLQRRFELAVDDVRQLKQENADLCKKIEAAPKGEGVVTEEQPLDWQSQKARLLASLEAEDLQEVTEARHEERVTLRETISITNSAIAKKDQRLAEQKQKLQALREQLEERPEDIEALRQQITNEILGNDQTVQIELTHLQEQQQKLQDKLREAELDISVQRATLAREQAAMEEKLANLPVAAPKNLDKDEPKEPVSKPRRRWLSALGIKEDEEPS